ncbi:hypothetical protein KUTeg_019674 [Tegillarca granosa]|uniref:Uncharacterized protein n=1 Tax=Tegillarca granosa TaxID=220873 RepID=A0ABQ9EDA4_TEGGR|nr:hypothetical protein KUTeg_019674 [Tegillarca granosa]
MFVVYLYNNYNIFAWTLEGPRSRILVTSSEVEKSSWAIWNDFYKKQFTLVLRKNTCNFRKTWKLSPATTKTVNDKDVPFQELVLKDKSTKLTLAV